MGETFPAGQLVDNFGALCDDAAAFGTRISLEMAPVTSIDRLSLARSIVEGAGRTNGGYMLDIWHINRAGDPLSEVAALPRGSVFGVELNDAARMVQGSLLQDTLHRRRFCGEGDFDVAGFVAAVRATGFDGPWGIEVLSDDLRKLPLDEAARRSYETTARAVGSS